MSMLGKILNVKREEVDDEVFSLELLRVELLALIVSPRVRAAFRIPHTIQLKEELVEAKGISRIFDDSDKNRNQIGWLGTMAQTYFPRFFTPDENGEDDDDNDDETEIGTEGGKDSKGTQ